MKIIAIDTGTNKLTLWDGVKSFDSLKDGFEKNLNPKSSIRYFLVLSKKEFLMTETYSIIDNEIKFFEFKYEEEEYEICKLESFVSFSDTEIIELYNEEERQDIQLAKSFENHKAVERGAAEPPEGYPLIPLRPKCRINTRTISKEEEVSSVSVKEIL